ncbi:hypothetical protein PR048_012989 [Dryococelus australis]|uniref:Uncharacterized protein n=1 Tax=Dryococelus australis TaxID=614101 RepID=A0ABQ9HRB9_9NEOP|nr:hypothetical protein PR048_012989 [Dryococelus australis]
MCPLGGCSLHQQLTETSKYIEISNLTIMKSFNAIDALMIKILQRKQDMFSGSYANKYLNKLDPITKEKIENKFLVFYGSLHSYIASLTNLSDNASIQSLLLLCLTKEVNFKDFQNIPIQLQLEVNEDRLYDKFSSLKENISAAI